MKEQKGFGKGLSNVAQWIVALISFLAFAFFSVVGLVQTCHVDIDFSKDNIEHVTFLNDNILLNLAVLAVFLMLAVLLMRVSVKRKTAVLVGAVSIALSAAIGVWWVLSSKSLPSADSLRIITAAQEVIKGNMQALTETFYFKTYPFQTGYLLFAEGFLRLFGSGALIPFQLLNVLFVVAAEIAMLLITKELFNDARVELLTAILLGLCIQPMLLSTFLYGTLPGMALAIWSAYFVIRAMRTKKLAVLIPALVLIALAIFLKKNFWIVLLAESILLMLFVIREKKWLFVSFIAVAAVLSITLPMLSQKIYEEKAGEPFGKGTPQMAWLVTGFRDSSLCAGWYNGYTNNILMQNDYNYDATLAQCKLDFAERVDELIHRPVYLGSFFYHKITSQWNEPAYQTIWSSATSDRSGEVSDLIESLSKGPASDAFNAYCNQLMQFVYIAMTVAFFVFLRKKEERSEARMIIPTILVGAVLYHALFEAKSQYAIIYVPMMLPYAAYGMKRLSETVFHKKTEAAKPEAVKTEE